MASRYAGREIARQLPTTLLMKPGQAHDKVQFLASKLKLPANVRG